MSARALWNLHDAVMVGEQPSDCPDCGADEWSPSAEAFETTGPPGLRALRGRGDGGAV